MLEVGQVLWFVPKFGSNYKITINKVGRIWADFDGRRGRVNIKTLEVFDGNYHVGRCYLDREKYESNVDADKLWMNLRIPVSCRRPTNVTSEDILAAAKLLKIDLEAK